MFHFEEFDVSIGIAIITCVLSYLRLENRRIRMKLTFKYLKSNVRRCLEFYLIYFKFMLVSSETLARLCKHTCSPEPSLITSVISTSRLFTKYPGTSSYGAPRKLNKMKQSVILSMHSSVFDFCNDRTEYLDASAT